MPLALLLLGLLVALCGLGADAPDPRGAPKDAPNYTAASIVNAADNQSDVLAPNTIGTIYGVNLAYSIAVLTGSDVHGGVLPIVLGDSQTSVYVGNFAADLYYVSPTQINFLVPPMLLPGPTTVRVLIDSIYGPIIPLTLGPAAPGLFQLDLQNAVASRTDGSVLTPSSPAKPGEIVILWATGLGATNPPAVYGQLPTAAAPLIAGANLEVRLDGVPVESGAIDYAGVAPGYAGLYQINFTLPASTPANPEIRLVMGSASSIPGLHLPVGP